MTGAESGADAGVEADGLADAMRSLGADVDELNVEGILYREDASAWSPSTDIDWEQDGADTLPAAKRDALADAATQFHYSNSSHMMLCGRLIEHSDDMAVKKLALYLAFSKMRNVDAWGRYLGSVTAETEIAPYTKEYLSTMFEEQDVPALLLGMGVLGGTVGYGVLDRMQDAGDQVFKQIADHICEQKRQNEELLVNYLQDAVRAMNDEQQNQLVEQATFYRDQSERIVLFHSDLLKALDLNPQDVADHVLDATDAFYEKIGIMDVK